MEITDSTISNITNETVSHETSGSQESMEAITDKNMGNRAQRRALAKLQKRLAKKHKK